MIVALDEGIRRDLLLAAERENTGDVRWYSDRLCSISTFSHYLGDEILAGMTRPWHRLGHCDRAGGFATPCTQHRLCSISAPPHSLPRLALPRAGALCMNLSRPVLRRLLSG